MNSRDKAKVGKVERLARWALWPALPLTVVCLAMLYTGVLDKHGNGFCLSTCWSARQS